MMLAPAALSEESKANAAPSREAFDSPLGALLAGYLAANLQIE